MIRLLFTALLLSLCDANSPTCGPQIEKKVGDDVEIPSCSTGPKEITNSYWKYREDKLVEISESSLVVKDSPFKGRVSMSNTTFNLILSGLTLQDSGTFGFFSATDQEQIPTRFFTLRVYEAITNVTVRKINSTRTSNTTCTMWLECAASGGSRAYTWALGNRTYDTGAALKYESQEAEETVSCVVSNPVSTASASARVECSTAGAVHIMMMHIWAGLGAGLLVLVLVVLVSVFVCRLKRGKAAPEPVDTLYDTLDNVLMKDTTSDAELTLGSLYETVNFDGMRPPSQRAKKHPCVKNKSDDHTIYYTVQPSVLDPSS